MFKHNQMVIFFNNKKEDICDEKSQISPPKRHGKGSFLQFLPQRKVTFSFPSSLLSLLWKSRGGKLEKSEE